MIYLATIRTALTDDFCDVAVAEAEVKSFTMVMGRGESLMEPVLTTTDQVVMHPIDTTVSTAADDKQPRAILEAEQLLSDHGWTVISGLTMGGSSISASGTNFWTVDGDSLTARVERTSEHKIARNTAYGKRFDS